MWLLPIARPEPKSPGAPRPMSTIMLRCRGRARANAAAPEGIRIFLQIPCRASVSEDEASLAERFANRPKRGRKAVVRLWRRG